jgi:hypothetical protein
MSRSSILRASSALAISVVTLPVLADVPPLRPTSDEEAFEAGYAAGQLLGVGCVCLSVFAIFAVVAIVVVVLVRRRSP